MSYISDEVRKYIENKYYIKGANLLEDKYYEENFVDR